MKNTDTKDHVHDADQVPVVPARGWAEVALDLTIRPFWTCMRRAPARCCCPSARASLLLRCFPRTWPVRHHVGIKSDSETSQDCATWIAQLFGRIAQLGLRNLDCATPRIAQLWLRNCIRRIAQLPGLRNSDCATAFDGLRNCIRRIAQLLGLRNSDCATAFDGLRNS